MTFSVKQKVLRPNLNFVLKQDINNVDGAQLFRVTLLLEFSLYKVS